MRLDSDAVRPDAATLEQLEPALGLTLTTEQRTRLLAYLDLIARWNQVYNLTALRTPAETFSHHLLDCLAILPALRRRLSGRDHPRLLDVGSGAGLPGVILAIVEPDWRITCVDAVAKKTSFIRQVASELSLPNLQAVHARVEQANAFQGQPFDLIVSRAFASLEDFTRLTSIHLAPDACWVAMKAHLTEAERAELSPNIEMFHVEPLHVPMLEAERCLVWMRPHASSSPEPTARRQ